MTDDKRKATMWLLNQLTDDELKQVLRAPVVVAAMLKRVSALLMAEAMDTATMEAHDAHDR